MGYCCGEDENERKELGRKPAGGTSTIPFQTGRDCAHMHLRWTHTLSRDSRTVGKVGLHVPMSLTRPGPGAAAPPAGQDKEGVGHTKIMYL